MLCWKLQLQVCLSSQRASEVSRRFSVRQHRGLCRPVTQMVSRIDEFYAHLAARPRSSADAAAESRLAQGKAGLTGAEH